MIAAAQTSKVRLAFSPFSLPKLCLTTQTSTPIFPPHETFFRLTPRSHRKRYTLRKSNGYSTVHAGPMSDPAYLFCSSTFADAASTRLRRQCVRISAISGTSISSTPAGGCQRVVDTGDRSPSRVKAPRTARAAASVRRRNGRRRRCSPRERRRRT